MTALLEGKLCQPHPAGRKQLKAEEASWNRFSAVVASVLGALPERS